jgi:hypothetical protein
MRRLLILAFLILAFVPGRSPAADPAPGHRVAFVIGNGGYRNVAPLGNPATTRGRSPTGCARSASR